MLNQVKNALATAFPTASIHVEDFSCNHHGHTAQDNAHSHLRIIMVEASFKDLSTLQRQRQVNDILAPFFDQGLHAVELKLSHA